MVKWSNGRVVEGDVMIAKFQLTGFYQIWCERDSVHLMRTQRFSIIIIVILPSPSSPSSSTSSSYHHPPIPHHQHHYQHHHQVCFKRFWLRHYPSLFQHIGTHSSLAGKTQKLKDGSFWLGNLSASIISWFCHRHCHSGFVQMFLFQTLTSLNLNNLT